MKVENLEKKTCNNRTKVSDDTHRNLFHQDSQ